MPNENMDGEEVNFPQALVMEAIKRELDFDPEKTSQMIARSLCEPTSALYKRNPSLKKDPFKAMGEVSLTDIREEDIKDPVAGLVVGAAKLETAKKELNLDSKQKDIFDGVLDNIHGAIAWASQNKTFRKAVIGAEVAALTLTSAGCINVVNTPEIIPTASPVVETPAAGQAVAVGLLNAHDIATLPAGEVKTSLEGEIASVKEECAKIPGCLEDSVQIYRVIVPDNVFSIRFANFETGSEPKHTEIMSIMDGATKNAEKINKDLLTKETVMDDGVTTRIFGYVDDAGVSHPILVERLTPEGDKFQIFDTTGKSYDVITGSAQEVQSLSHLWEDPSVVKGETLPTPTNEATPTPEQVSLYHEMTLEEMQSRELYGYGISVDTQVEGLDTSYFIVTSDSLMKKMAEFGYGPFVLSSGMENDTSMPLNSAERLGRMLRLADYLGYLQDKGIGENNYSFDQYIADLKKGEDRSYVVYYLHDKIIVDPTKNKELVFVYDLDFKNGFFNFKSGVNSQFGYLQNQEGGLRIINVITQTIVDGNIVPRIKENNLQIIKNIFAWMMSGDLKSNLLTLSLSEQAQQGKKIDGDPYYVSHVYDDIKMSTPARKEMVTLDLSPYITADPNRTPFFDNALVNK